MPPLRTMRTAWANVPGAPEHSSTSSTPASPARSRTAATGSTFSKSTTASAPIAAAASRRAPRPTTITRAAPNAFANRIAMRPIGPGPMITTVPPGVMPASSIAVQRRAARVDQRPFPERHLRQQRTDAADGIDVVLRVGAGRDEAVVAVPGFGAPVVLAEVVAALQAVAAVAAALVRFAGHAVAWREPAHFRARPRPPRPPTRVPGVKGYDGGQTPAKVAADDLRDRCRRSRPRGSCTALPRDRAPGPAPAGPRTCRATSGRAPASPPVRRTSWWISCSAIRRVPPARP